MACGRHALLAVALLAVPLVGCVGSDDDTGADPIPPGPMEASSSAFVPGERIPQAFTCDGEGLSPPFTVTGLPNGTVTVALIAGDPDVPTPELAAQNFTHWLFWDAEPAERQLMVPRDDTPEGAVEGENDGGSTGYTGPCPPAGSPPHRYVFTFYAVDTRLDLEEGANRSQLEAALEGHVLEQDAHVGTYERSRDTPPIQDAP